MNRPAPFVWIDEHGQGRNLYVCFRCDLEIDAQPSRAVLNLFADTRYHLRVNGTFVGYGPARCDLPEPEYDTYDLAPHLRAGANVVAVRVLSHGTNTFQNPTSRGAFVAWGEVQTGGGETFSLATPDAWLCRKSRAYDPTAPRFSFAGGPIELYDQRKDVPDWDQAGAVLTDWRKPTPLADDSDWGELAPRSIPHLTQEEVLPQSLLAVYPIQPTEHVVSFRVKTPDRTQQEYGRKKRLFAYTYIHSPRSQAVRVGLFWGEHYLNGRGPLPAHPARDDQPHRLDRTLRLRKGWNEFFIKYDAVWGSWDFYMAIPPEAGLWLSPTRHRPDGREGASGEDACFMTAGPFTDEEERDVLDLALPFGPEDLPDLSAGWVPRPREGSAGNPAIEMIRRRVGREREIDSSQVSDLPAGDPDGTAMVFDMGCEVLGRIFVEYDAPAGTVIDAGFAESLLPEPGPRRPCLLRRHGVFAADRHVAAGGPSRMETFKPRGFRYLEVDVTEASGPVRIRRVGTVRQIYPFEKVGSFECSDPMMNRVWELGWRTLRLCAEDAYTDCPWRERGLYAGDTLPELAITLATSGDCRLARRCLKLFHRKYALRFAENASLVEEGRTVADFPIITLLILDWYLQRTGDTDFARRLYPAYDAMMRATLPRRGDDGLFAEQHVFVEWTEMEKDCRSTALHALTAGGFAALGRIADTLGNPEEARRHAGLADEIGESIRRHFWDEQEGAFRDGIKDGKPIDSHYPISSALPSLFGLTSPEQEQRLGDYFARALESIEGEKKRMLTSPYGGFYVLGALYRHGRAGLAERFIRHGWSRMILAGADTAREHFTDDASQCHAWSGGPTFYLSSQALGVGMGFPVPRGPEGIEIAPLAETLNWARGTVPHPAGPIRVEWRVDGDDLRVDCHVPDGVEWRVTPRGRLGEKRLWVNGEPRSASVT